MRCNYLISIISRQGYPQAELLFTLGNKVIQKAEGNNVETGIIPVFY
ncbi:MAG: hypothetical protein Q8940_21025 [Bacteroidota bacterium]|nr:hypothetical protein [Bacteroidota bacterium]